MKIEKKALDSQKTLHHLMTETMGWDHTFEYEGRNYVLIAKGDSQHTTLRCDLRFYPVFNLKSRTIRALPANTVVYPKDCTVYVEGFHDEN